MESQGHYMETFSFLLVIHLCILFDFLLFVYGQHIVSLFYPISFLIYFAIAFFLNIDTYT